MKTIEHLIPMEAGKKFNEMVTADTNIFTSELVGICSPTLMRIYICLNTSTKLHLKRTEGITTITEYLNSDADLSANCSYIFDVFLCSPQKINLQVTADCTILSLQVVEIPMVQ